MYLNSHTSIVCYTRTYKLNREAVQELIYLPEIPQARFRPRFAARKIEDLANFGGELLHPHAMNSDLETRYENLPLRQEVILPLGDFLNRLVVRGHDGLYARQSVTREDAIRNHSMSLAATGQVLAPDTLNMVYHAKHQCYSALGVGGAADSGSLDTTDTEGSSATATAEANFPLFGVYNQKDNNTDAYDAVLGWGSAMSNTLKAAQRNSFMALWMTGGRRHSSQPVSATIRPWTTHTIDSEAAWNEAAEDFGLTFMHTSALSFVYQFKDELQRLASKTQYLSQELVGFIEKGMKGDFLRDQTPLETWLTIMFVEFGKALRTQRWTRNVVPINQLSVDNIAVSETGLLNGQSSGVVNPFYVELNKGAYGIQMMPYWVAPLIDREHFEYDETIDDVRDIHREDLFMGLKALLDAASLEMGMGWKGVGNPYLDFFESMDDAKLPDLTELGDLTAMRTLQMAGFENMEQFHNREQPTDNMQRWAFFDNMISDGTISQSARLDLAQDMAQLDSLPCLTGSRFKEGMQLLGPFENTEFHRATRFGEHTVDVEYRPWVLIRPMSYETKSFDLDATWSGDGAADTVTGYTTTTYPLYTLGADTLSMKPTDDVHTHVLAPWNFVDSDGGDCPVSNAANPTTTALTYHTDFTADTKTKWISWPSVDKGWNTFAKGQKHTNFDAVQGYGALRIGSHSVNADSNIEGVTWTWPYVGNTGGALGANSYQVISAGGAPTCPEAYWRVGFDGVYTSMVPLLNRVYKAWQGRTDGLFRRSELKNLLSFSAVNLHREMKMNTPEAFFAKFGREITLSMTCAATPYDPGLLLRHMNRHLTNGAYHARKDDTRFLVSPFVVEPSGIEDVFAAQHLMGFLMGLYGPGLGNRDAGALVYAFGDAVYRGSSTTSNFLRHALRKSHNFNPSVNETNFFPLNEGALVWPYYHPDYIATAGIDKSAISSGSGVGGCYVPWFTPNRSSTMRTFYQSYKAIDGAETYIACTPMGAWLGVDPKMIGNSWYQDQCKIFNMLTETVHYYGLRSTDPTVANLSCHSSSSSPEAWEPAHSGWDIGAGTTAELFAGHRTLFEIWRLDYQGNLLDKLRDGGTFGPAHVTDDDTDPLVLPAVDSLCTGFGTSSVASDVSIGGVNGTVDSLLSFRAPVEFLTANLSGVINQTDGYEDASPGGFQYGQSGAASEYRYVTNFNQDWLDYVENRSGGLNGTPADVVIWRRAAPQLLIYDEDVLDTDEGMLGALLWLGHRVSHPGQLTYLAVLNPDGTLGYEIRGQYSWGSGADVSASAETATGTEDIPEYEA